MFPYYIMYSGTIAYSIHFLSGRQGKEDKPLLPIDELAENGKEIKIYRAVGKNKEIDILVLKPLYLKQIKQARKSIFTILRE